MVGIPWIGHRLATRSNHTIRRLVGFIQLHSQWIAAQQWSKWLAARRLVNAAQLPTSKRPLSEPRAHFRSRQLPGKVRRKNLAHIEVRQTPSGTLIEEKW